MGQTPDRLAAFRRPAPRSAPTEWVDNNPQTLVSDSASGGIQNLRTDPSTGTNWNLYDWQAGATKGGPTTGVSLIGACFASSEIYSIRIVDISYASGPAPTIGAPTYFLDTSPEPAGLLLMTLAGLLLRPHSVARTEQK